MVAANPSPGFRGASRVDMHPSGKGGVSVTSKLSYGVAPCCSHASAGYGSLCKQKQQGVSHSIHQRGPFIPSWTCVSLCFKRCTIPFLKIFKRGFPAVNVHPVFNIHYASRFKVREANAPVFLFFFISEAFCLSNCLTHQIENFLYFKCSH